MGDTDSIFETLNLRKNGSILPPKQMLKICMEIGKLCSNLLFKILPEYQNMCFEKALFPLALVSKKRYVGNKYEHNENDYYQASMGIVLKRRDNCALTKIVVGLIVRSILNDRSIEKAIAFTKETLRNILTGKYHMDKFVITKTLKGPSMNKQERKIEQAKHKDDRYYSDRTRLAHVVLADRMADRDKGSAPQSNDRVSFAYVITKGEISCQGDRVEDPNYIIKNKLELDYIFYLTNQIMKPSIQFLELLTDNPAKIFEHVIMIEQNRQQGKRPLNYYFRALEDLAKVKDMPDAFKGEDDSDNEDDDEEDIEMNKFNSIFVTNFSDDSVKDTPKNVIVKGNKSNVIKKAPPKRTGKSGVRKLGSCGDSFKL